MLQKGMLMIYRVRDDSIEVVRILLAKSDYMSVLFPDSLSDAGIV